MTVAAILTWVYAVLSLVGGIIGFVQAGSRVSLLSGLITGVLLAIAGVGLWQSLGWALWLAIAVTLLLLVVFVGRLVKTRKWMPAGLMVVVGVATLLTQVHAWRTGP